MLMLVPGRVSLKQESSTIVYTPWKINMEPKNDDLEDVYFPFPMGDIFRFHVTFRGSMFRHLIWKNKSILISYTLFLLMKYMMT